MLNRTGLLSCLAILAASFGCANNDAPPPAGFLSNYSSLQAAEGGAMRYASPELKNYSSFMVDPVQIRSQRQSAQIKQHDQAQVALYFHESLVATLGRHGYRIVQAPGAGVGRIRIALTDIHEAKWWRQAQPRDAYGTGTGGASMEGEVVDSVSGAQIAAVIQTGSGNLYYFSALSTMDDVKATIDEWCRAAAVRLDNLRETGRTQ